MMMALGQFIFSLPTLAYNDFKRQTAWRHPSNSRVGARPARQSLGPGEDTITLCGLLAPEFAGRKSALDELREMGDQGKAWSLVDGTGEVFGAWVIESLSEAGSHHTEDGVARRIEFDMTLARVDDDQADGGGGVDPGPIDDYWEWWL
ncbi:MAG: phage tail protein [Rhodoferax sp.]